MEFLNISLPHWFLFIGINGLLLASSYCVASRLTQVSSYAVTLATALLLYLSQITVSVLLLGVVVKWLSAVSLGGLNGVLSVWLIRRYGGERKPLYRSFRSHLGLFFSQADIWTYVLFVLLILQIGLSLYKAGIMPVHIADSLSYRAPPAVMWYQMGFIPSVLDVPVNEINGRSLGIAVLMLWYFVFLQDSLLVNLPQFVSSLVLIFIVYAIARQCGVTRSWAFKASVLCYFMPSVLIQSTATQDHLSINVAFLAALFFLREFFLRKDKHLILLMGVSIGLMFGFKNNAFVYMPVLFGAGLYLYWQHRAEWGKTLPYKTWRRYGALAAVIAFSIGGYWTARNLIVFHDLFGIAFVPMDKINDAYHLIVEEGQGLQQAGSALVQTSATNFLRSNNLFDNLAEFFPRILDNGFWTYAGHMKNMSGFGPQFFTFGLLALFWLVVSFFKRSWRVPGMFYAVTGLILLLGYFCAMHNVYAYRNFSFFAILLLVFFVCMASFFDEKKGGMVHGVGVLMTFCVLWSMYVVAPPVFSNASALKGFVELDRIYQTPGRYINYFRAHPKVFRQLTELPEDEGITYVNKGSRNTWIYAHYDVHWTRRVEYTPMRDELMTCNDDDNYCIPSQKFKELLIKKNIFLVSTCVDEHCMDINDPQFFSIGLGLSYFSPES